MGRIRSSADFPDLAKGLDQYEGHQRRSEQVRNDNVGRLLSGMDRLLMPGGDGRTYEVIGRRSGGSAAAGKWGLVRGTNGRVRLAPGRVWDADRSVTIEGWETEYTPADAWSFWLEKTGASYGEDWSLRVKAGQWPDAEYDFETSGDLTLMAVYRKRLLSFWAEEPEGVPVDVFSPSLYVERHVGLGDLKAVSGLVNGSPKAVAVLELIAC